MNLYLCIFAFALFCAVLVECGIRSTRLEYALLVMQKQSLTSQLSKLQVEHEDLLLDISSHNDPAWIELILIRELGLIPEGTKKVVFTATPSKTQPK